MPVNNLPVRPRGFDLAGKSPEINRFQYVITNYVIHKVKGSHRVAFHRDNLPTKTTTRITAPTSLSNASSTQNAYLISLSRCK